MNRLPEYGDKLTHEKYGEVTVMEVNRGGNSAAKIYVRDKRGRVRECRKEVLTGKPRLTAKQNQEMSRLWMAYGHPRSITGQDGLRTHGNHKYLQRLVEGRPDAAELVKQYATKKCIAAVEEALK